MTRSSLFAKEQFRFSRYFMILAAVLLVSACSSDDEEELVLDGQPSASRDGITDGPLDQIYQGDVQQGGPAPGTQADLVVNVGDRVFFGTDRYDLSGEARQILDNQAAWLQKYPSLSITIEGHADERGTREYNLALGERRANSVRNYLAALGVSAAQINTVSYGKERPAVPGANDSAWSQNRRSVTKVN